MGDVIYRYVEGLQLSRIVGRRLYNYHYPPRISGLCSSVLEVECCSLPITDLRGMSLDFQARNAIQAILAAYGRVSRC